MNKTINTIILIINDQKPRKDKKIGKNGYRERERMKM